MGKLKLIILSFFMMGTASAELTLGGTLGGSLEDSGDGGDTVLVRCKNGKVFEMRSFPGQGCMHVMKSGNRSAYMKVCSRAAAMNLACRGK